MAQHYPAQAHRQEGGWLDTCLIWSPGGNISPQGFSIFQYQNLFWGSSNVNTDTLMFEVNKIKSNNKIKKAGRFLWDKHPCRGRILRYR